MSTQKTLWITCGSLLVASAALAVPMVGSDAKFIDEMGFRVGFETVPCVSMETYELPVSCGNFTPNPDPAANADIFKVQWDAAFEAVRKKLNLRVVAPVAGQPNLTDKAYQWQRKSDSHQQRTIYIAYSDGKGFTGYNTILVSVFARPQFFGGNIYIQLTEPQQLDGTPYPKPSQPTNSTPGPLERRQQHRIDI